MCAKELPGGKGTNIQTFSREEFSLFRNFLYFLTKNKCTVRRQTKCARLRQNYPSYPIVILK